MKIHAVMSYLAFLRKQLLAGQQEPSFTAVEGRTKNTPGKQRETAETSQRKLQEMAETSQRKLQETAETSQRKLDEKAKPFLRQEAPPPGQECLLPLRPRAGPGPGDRTGGQDQDWGTGPEGRTRTGRRCMLCQLASRGGTTLLAGGDYRHNPPTVSRKATMWS